MTNQQQILNIISEHLGIDVKKIQLDHDLIEDLNSQKLEIADLIMKLEKTFSIHLTPDDSSTIKTVQDIIDLFAND